MPPKSSLLILGGITLAAIAGGVTFAVIQPASPPPTPPVASTLPTPSSPVSASPTSPALAPVAPASPAPAPPPPQPAPPKADSPQADLPPLRDLKSCEVKMAIVHDSDPPLNVRSGPTIESSKVGQLQNGTYVTVMDEQNGWFQISDPVRGWLAKSRTKSGCSEKVERVSFGKGQVSMAIADQFVGTGYHQYLLNAGKGQTMTIRVQDGPMPFVQAPNGSVIEPYDDGKTEWSKSLLASGDYTLQLDSNYKGYTYSFVVEIK